MEAKAKSLTFLSNEASVKIPFFQRAYVWNKENWEELISDLLKTDKSHFLGSLILKQDTARTGSTKRVSVIDGQQRLTTLSILLRTLFDSFDSETQEACKQEFETCLFYKKKATAKESFVKIEHSKIDRKHYQRVIQKEVNADSPDFDVENSNILKCYKYYTDRLKMVDYDRRIELFDNLMDDEKKILVVIDLTDADDEQSIFDTINSAGMRLSSADIVKNALFQRAIDFFSEDEVECIYKENWENVFAVDEEAIEFWGTIRTLGRLKRDNLEILLHSFAVIEGFFDPEKNTLTELSNIYKTYINGLGKYELNKFCNSISEYAKLYRDKVYIFESSDLFSYDDYHKRIFHILSVCDVSTFHPYILYLYKNFAGNEAALKSALHKLETLVIRRFVCNSEVKNYNLLCRDFITDRSKVDSILLDTPDDEFIAALQRINNKSAALLLFWVELFRRKNDKRYDREELKYTYSLEHIMPQKWEEYWSSVPVIGDDGMVINDTELAKQYRYRQIYSIGNMTLLRSSLNSSIRNYEFKRKVEGEGRKRGIKHYAELGITKLDVIAPFDGGDNVWDESKIRNRGSEITKDVLTIWS